MDIRGRCGMTDMQSLINTGLFELKVKLGNTSYWTQWAKRVASLRNQYRASKDFCPASRTEVRKAISIAETLFGVLGSFHFR